MRVAKDAVHDEIFVKNGSTDISRALRDSAFCKSLLFRDSFTLNSEYLNDF